MNCERCASQTKVIDTIIDHELTHEGEFERDEDGYEIFGEYDIHECVECHHKKRKFSRWVDYFEAITTEESGGTS